MKPTIAAALAALSGAALWLVWNVEHEHTGIRAPWTGATYAASALAFIATGYLGRGWRALLCAALAGIAAVLLVDFVVWRSEPVDPTTEASCDPGCISTEVAAIAAAVGASALAALGMGARLVLGLTPRRRRTAA